MNMKLSEDRANSVAAYLVKKGVAADQLTTKGYGPTRPVAANDSAAGRAKNRRVELKPIK
jgi:OOP family OmpA-OmpF porin